MNAATVVSPDDQGATFVELFFDLVFVFAITQITHYAAHHLDLEGVLRSLLVFWLIWWGWTQFTWALNAANTDHHGVRVGTLVATGIAFVMAASVDGAFAAERAGALGFALAYVGVRVLGLALYLRVTAGNAEQRSAVVVFSALSLGGLLAVLMGGLVDPSLRAWFWLAAVVLDVVAAVVAGERSAWGVHAGHFAERHGLIVIIALGESLIVAGGAIAGGGAPEVLASGALAVVVTCLLWWTYFGWVQGVLEHRLEAVEGADRSALARDAYSLMHFPLVCGIVALAVGFEAVFHPADYSMAQTAMAVAVGISLFVVATAISLWRAVGCVLWNRLVVLVPTLAGLVVSIRSSPAQVLGVVCGGLMLIIAIEHYTVRRRLAAETVG